MKKKIVAGLCACALAFAIPAAAIADPSAEFTATQDGNTVSLEGTAIADSISKVVISGAENVTISDITSDEAFADYDQEGIDQWSPLVKDAYEDGAELIAEFEINGDITGGKAILTFYLNADKYGNKTITYFILHKTPDANGNYVQKKVVNVNPDGTVTIFMDRFSIITFMDVEGIAKYENMVEPQDGALLSPKTGC